PAPRRASRTRAADADLHRQPDDPPPRRRAAARGSERAARCRGAQRRRDLRPVARGLVRAGRRPAGRREVVTMALESVLRDTLATVEAQRDDAIAYLGAIRSVMGALRRMPG